MSDRLEWAHTTSKAELLYPGTDVDEAVVDPGEIAVAIWTGSNGIALHGPREQLRDRLLQLAAAVHDAPPVPTTEACISEDVDPRRWEPGLPFELVSRPTTFPSIAKCRYTHRPVTNDPRMATCLDCIDQWNREDPNTHLSLSHPIPSLS
ncbi:hypothetical protein [Streptomyces sp. XH2]|uniref:hypothetical protein n=1 Tax=Streptomyces sp. XH2 TaxID=3412483 RepID=UPI003C7BB6A3